MGSLFAVDVAHVPDAGEFFGWAGSNSVEVVATSGRADSDHWNARYRPPLVVLFGSEGEGLPAQFLSRSDMRVRIPMVGTAESLNLAAAAAIMLYEVRRMEVGAASQ